MQAFYLRKGNMTDKMNVENNKCTVRSSVVGTPCSSNSGKSDCFMRFHSFTNIKADKFINKLCYDFFLIFLDNANITLNDVGRQDVLLVYGQNSFPSSTVYFVPYCKFSKPGTGNLNCVNKYFFSK